MPATAVKKSDFDDLKAKVHALELVLKTVIEADGRDWEEFKRECAAHQLNQIN